MADNFNILAFIFRIWLIAAFCAVVYKYLKPKNPQTKILRAAVLVVGLLTILVFVRFLEL